MQASPVSDISSYQPGMPLAHAVSNAAHFKDSIESRALEKKTSFAKCLGWGLFSLGCFVVKLSFSFLEKLLRAKPKEQTSLQVQAVKNEKPWLDLHDQWAEDPSVVLHFYLDWLSDDLEAATKDLLEIANDWKNNPEKFLYNPNDAEKIDARREFIDGIDKLFSSLILSDDQKRIYLQIIEQKSDEGIYHENAEFLKIHLDQFHQLSYFILDKFVLAEDEFKKLKLREPNLFKHYHISLGTFVEKYFLTRNIRELTTHVRYEKFMEKIRMAILPAAITHRTIKSFPELEKILLKLQDFLKGKGRNINFRNFIFKVIEIYLQPREKSSKV